MSAYTKFDLGAYRQKPNREAAAAKAANVAKEPEPEQSAALASLATLAAEPAEIENDEPQLDPYCRYCDKIEAAEAPLLPMSVDGEIFVAHAACREREWQAMKAEHERWPRMLAA